MGRQASSKFFSRHACAEGALQCCRGDGSSFSFIIEGAPHYRHCGETILTRPDGPPSSFPPTHRPRDKPGGISAARPHCGRCGKIILTSLSTQDEHCGCASLHFQPWAGPGAGPGDGCGMPAGDAGGMPAACLHACMPACLHACRHASGILQDMPAGCAGILQQASVLLAQDSKMERMPECLP